MKVEEWLLSTIGAALVGALVGLFVFGVGCLFDGYDGMAEADNLWGNIRWWAGIPAVGIGGFWFVVGLVSVVSSH